MEVIVRALDNADATFRTTMYDAIYTFFPTKVTCNFLSVPLNSSHCCSMLVALRIC